MKLFQIALIQCLLIVSCQSTVTSYDDSDVITHHHHHHHRHMNRDKPFQNSYVNNERQFRTDGPRLRRGSEQPKIVAACWNQTSEEIYLTDPKNCSRKNIVAGADIKNSINSTGWAYLEVSTNPKFSDQIQAYAAGAVESAVSSDLIDMHIHNTFYFDCVNPKTQSMKDYCGRLSAFLASNHEYMLAQIKNNTNDPYWKQVELVMYQLSGLEDTQHMYKAPAKIQPLKVQMNAGPMMIYVQLGGDLEDLEQALKKPKSQWRRKTGYGSCSALIKTVDNNRDLLVAHDTWSTYQSMLRIMKLYNLNFKGVPSKAISFSSYPGTLLSIDDFYITSSGLTTIGNNNASLWKYVKPQTVLTWIRTQVANRISTDARMWAQTFAKENSGTYNNQWMIVDYKQFVPGNSMQNQQHLFWVLEQTPGFIKMSDMSSVLVKQGYWPSYNVPYYPEVFNRTGGRESVAKYGDWFSYDKTPRALIFKREWQKVTNMSSLTTLMRYNNFEKDPLSKCNCTPPYSAENAIAARSDLNPKNGTYPFASLGHRNHGATDMKATSYNLMRRLRFVGISGPTYDQQPAFKWSTADFESTTPHHGHPDNWQFKPVTVKWSKFNYITKKSQYIV